MIECIAARPPEARWMVAGDFNAVANESAAALALIQRGGAVFKSDVPTTWSSRQTIDYAVANMQIEVLDHGEEKFSDHRAVRWAVQLRTTPTMCNKLAKKADLTKPKDALQQDWQGKIAAEWAHHHDTVMANLGNDTTTVDGAWQFLEECLELSMTEAMGKIEGIEPRREAQKGATKISNGRNPCNRHRQGGAASFRLWRRYRTIGRLLDLDKRYTNGLGRDMDAQIAVIERRLARAAGITLSDDVDERPNQNASEVNRLNEDVDAEWKRITKARLEHWRNEMCNNSAARARCSATI